MTLPSTQVDVPELRDYIDGEFMAPTVELGVWLENPNTGEKISQQMATSDENIEKALAAAWRVHQDGTWANMPIEERIGYLMSMSEELEKRKERIAQLDALATGTTIGLNSMLGLIVTGAWQLAAEQLKSGWLHSTMPGPNDNLVHIHRKPWGPALCLIAWNAPATFVAHKAANSLAAGCPTIVKPTEWAPFACDIYAEAAEAAGFPPGVFQIVHGGVEVGKKLVADERIKAVSFTGGVEGGRSIAQACAPSFKPAQLELGGNNPMIVMKDADLDWATEGVVSLMTSLNAQWCRALGRLIVHEDVKDTLMEKIKARFANLKIGDSLDFESEMGPLIHSEHKALVQKQLDALITKGGKATTLADVPEGGNFMAPTLVEGIAIDAAQDEIFGPVATVFTYKTEDEALALANGTPYGLEAYLYSTDEDKALAFGEKIHSGGVKINGATMLSLSIMAPRPAWGQSGMNEEGTIETFQFFTNTRVVGVEGPLQF